MARKRRKKARPTPPRRLPNAEVRPREHLTPSEVERVIAAAGRLGRHSHRDATMVLIAYRHGLRACEVVALRWDQIDLKHGVMHVHRRKNGMPSTHPLRGPETRALRKLARDYPETPYVFVTERGGAMTDSNFRKLVARAGRKARIKMPIHPHMLRHGTGYKLANDGRDTRAIQHYLGHRNIQSTVRYTEMSPTRFKDFWDD
jgi:type 1 fimbriae regulatory protein FimB/type 1 fimbriae regulatory protein FimE